MLLNVTNGLWIGDSAAAEHVDMSVGAVFNVAHDLEVDCDCRVGLIDGPGNEVEMYCAAVYALHALRKKGSDVLVCCHSGSRSLAVCVMYVSLLNGCSWDRTMAILCERLDTQLPNVHPVHSFVLEEVARCVNLS